MIVIDDRRALGGLGGGVEYARGLTDVARAEDVLVLSDLSSDSGIVATLMSTVRIPRLRAARALISVVPALRPLIFGGCHWIVVHDGRHLIEPASYTPPQRAYRNAVLALAQYRNSHIITVSDATKAVLSSRWPQLAARAETVHAGVTVVEDDGTARLFGTTNTPLLGLAFGHLPNKQPEIAVRAWLYARNETGRLGRLSVVGIQDSADRRRLQQLDPTGEAINVLPFLAAHDFSQLRQGSSIVLLPSSHEGFGLPVLEALIRHQVPVISPDPALVEVAHGRGVIADASSVAAFAGGILEAVRRLDTQREAVLEAAATAREQTWLRTWEKISRLVNGESAWRCPRCTRRQRSVA
jgi:glycosyltransferase involved in cell wall biosynthesis